MEMVVVMVNRMHLFHALQKQDPHLQLTEMFMRLDVAMVVTEHMTDLVVLRVQEVLVQVLVL